jgi:hypothetical protein
MQICMTSAHADCKKCNGDACTQHNTTQPSCSSSKPYKKAKPLKKGGSRLFPILFAYSLLTVLKQTNNTYILAVLFSCSFFCLLKFSKNVLFTVQENVLISQLHLGSAIFRKQNFVTSHQSSRMQLSGDVSFSRTNGNYLSFIGILCGVCWEEDSAGSLDFLRSLFDKDAVSQRSKFAEEGLRICVIQYNTIQYNTNNNSTVI